MTARAAFALHRNLLPISLDTRQPSCSETGALFPAGVFWAVALFSSGTKTGRADAISLFPATGAMIDVLLWAGDVGEC